jgi:hypothetical protein
MRVGAQTFGIVVAAVVLTAQIPAQKPNFTGTWKLNVERSGPILPRGLTGLVLILDHRDPSTILVTGERVTGKPGVIASVFGEDPPGIIDGKEHVIKPRPGKTVSVTVQWSGFAMVRHQVITADGTDYFSDTRTTLSADGKILTIAEQYREPGMERIRDWVFEKQ